MMGDNNDIGASSTRANDLLVQLLTRLIDIFSPSSGLSQGLAGLAASGIRSSLGSNAGILDSILASDKTAYGIAVENRLNAADLISQNVARDYRTVHLRDTLMSVSKAFSNAPSSDINSRAYREWEADIRRQVDGYMQNGFTTTILSKALGALGIDDTEAIAANLSGVASNIMRNGMRSRGVFNRSTLAAGRIVAENLLGIDAAKIGQGGQGFNPEEWGGFSAKGVTGIAEALSRSTDILAGVDASSTVALDNATKRFREMVKKYSDALEPLRDVFGNDTAKMMHTLEALTGQSVSQMGIGTVRRLALTASERLMSGQFSLGELSQVTNAVNARLAQMPAGMSSGVYLTAMPQAMAALDMMKGPRGHWMNEAQWNVRSVNNFVDTATSTAGDQINRAMAIRLHQMRQTNKNATIDDVRREAEAYEREYGGGMVLAYRRLAGINSAVDLQQAPILSEYNEVVRSGEGMRASYEGRARQMQAVLTNRAGMSYGIRKATGMSSQQARVATANLFAAMQASDYALMTLADNDQQREMLRGMTDQNGRRRYTDQQIEQMIAVGNYLSSEHGNDLAVVQQAGSLGVAARRQAQAGKRRDTLRELGLKVFNQGGIFEGLLKEGFSTEAFQKMLATGDMARVLGNDTELRDLVEISGSMLGTMTKNGVYDAEGAGKATMEFLRWANTAEGIADSAEVLSKYQSNKRRMAGMAQNSDEYKKLAREQKSLQAQAFAMSKVGKDAVARFMQSDVYTTEENGNIRKLTGDAADAQRLANLQSYIEQANKGGTSLGDSLRNAHIQSALAELDYYETEGPDPSKYSNVYKSFKDFWDKDGNKDKSLDAAWKDYVAQQKKNAAAGKDAVDEETLKKVGDVIHEAEQGTADKAVEGSPNALWEQIKNLLEKLNNWLQAHDRQGTDQASNETAPKKAERSSGWHA